MKRPPNFKLVYEDLPFRLPRLKHKSAIAFPKKVYTAKIARTYNQHPHNSKPRRPMTGLHSFTMWYKTHQRIDWKWIIIAFLLGLLLRSKSVPIGSEPVSQYLPRITLQKPLNVPDLSPQSELQTVYIPPAYTAPIAQTGVTNCGSDPSMAFIYQKESGCRTNAIGPNGPCGLGQALPCSKLPCSLSDWTCQNNWFTAYAISTYGSTYNAMLFWQNHSWW